MKRSRVLFLMAFCLFFRASSYAQDKTVVTTVDSLTGATNTTIYTVEDVKRNMFVVNPLNFINLYNLSFYHCFNNSSVIGIGIGIPPSEKFIGFALTAESRIYFSQKHLTGFYLGMNMDANTTSSLLTTTYKVGMSMGLVAGWQMFFADGIALGAGFGVSAELGSNLLEFHHTSPIFRFDIGYGW